MPMLLVLPCFAGPSESQDAQKYNQTSILEHIVEDLSNKETLLRPTSAMAYILKVKIDNTRLQPSDLKDDYSETQNNALNGLYIETRLLPLTTSPYNHSCFFLVRHA